MANYHSVAKILDELMLELIQRDVAIPPHVVDDLKAGRSFASIWLRQPNDEVADKAMFALQNVEMNLLSLAEINAGKENADVWQRRIIEAYQEDIKQAAPPAASKYVTGVPKGRHWIRIQAAELAVVEGLSALLDSYLLSSVAQEDGYLLIYGAKEDVSAFMKEIRQIIGKMEIKCKE